MRQPGGYRRHGVQGFDDIALDDESACEEGVVNGYSNIILRNELPGAPLPFIILMRRVFGGFYLLMGIIGLIVFFTGTDTCTKLSRQITAPNEQVGRTDEVAISKSSVEICPPLANAVTMLIVGIIMTVTSFLTNFRIYLCNGMNKHDNTILWSQMAFQGAMIVATVFPLAGIVNVYELIFATALSGAEFRVLWMFGEVNSAYFCKRDFMKLDRLYGTQFSDEVKMRSEYGSWLTTKFNLWEGPFWTAVIMHSFIWIVGLIHLIQSETAKNAKTEAGFVVLFIVVFILITFLLVAYALYLFDIKWFAQYRNLNLFFDSVLFFVHFTIFFTFLFT